MGIRFACHVCGKQLNIKRDLAGRRGVCPSCQSRFRIPLDDAEQSTPVEAAQMSSPQPLQTMVGNVATVGSGSVDSSAIGSEEVATNAVRENAAAYDPADIESAGASSELSVTSQPGFDEATGPGTGADAPHHGVVPTPSATPERCVEADSPVSDAPTHLSDASTMSILDDDPDATWYVRPPSGGQYGPASSDILRKWIGEGRVASTALLWRDGWPQWRDASEAMPELSDQLPKSDAAGAGAAATPRSGNSTKSDHSSSSTPRFSGEASIGADRRSRSMRRILMIGVLTALAATLIGILVVIINR